MKRPKLIKASFVIPVYNGQVFIKKAIESCLNQSISSVEVIVVDDASTDNSLRIVSHMASQDNRIKVHSLPENRGRCVARNLGNIKAMADKIFVLDADDISLPTRVADCLKYWEKNKGVDIVYGKFHLIDDFGQIGGLADVKAFDIEDVKRTGFTFIGHSTMAYRKKVADRVGYTDGDWSKNAIDDWKFQTDAYRERFRFGAINKILSQYRVSNKKRDEDKIRGLKNECLASLK